MLLSLLLLPGLGCKVRPASGLGEGPPQIDDHTAVLPAFDPAALTGPGAGGLDPSKAVSGPPQPPELPALPPPAVVDHGPLGEAGAFQDIHIRFNRPMVPLGEKQRVSAEQAGFRITPPIPGQAYWAEPTRLVFEPADQLPPAREYQVHYQASLQAVDGPSVDVALDWSFGTERPSVSLWADDDSHMEGGVHHWTTKVLVVAGQPLSLSTFRKHTRAEAIDPQGQAHPVEIRVRELPRDREGWREADFEIKPATRWPAGHEIVIRVDETLTSRAGPRPMGVEAAYSFPVAEGVEVASVTCYQGSYDDGCELGPVVVSFTSPLTRDQAKHVHISPFERGTQTLATDREQDWSSDKPKPLNRYWSVLVWGDFSLGKTYTVSVDDTVKDFHGQAFVGQDSFEVEFVEPPPRLVLEAGRGTFPIAKPAKVGVESRHVEALNLRVAVLDDEAAAEVFASDIELYWPPKTLAKTLQSRIPLTHSGNFGWSSHEIDLAQFTKGKPGTVLLEVSADGLLPRAAGRGLPTPRRGLVQITNLGVTAMGSLPGGAVRVARLDDDAPVAGARIEVFSAYADSSKPTVLGETDQDGLLRLPVATALPGQGFLRAVAGDDRVLISIANLAQNDYASADSPLRSGESIRAALMTERSLYQAGEQVRAMGWAAVASPYELSGLRPLPAKTRVRLELRDLRSDELIASRVVTAKGHGKFWATLDIPEAVALGDYRVTASLYGTEASADLQIKDYPIPEFEVTAQSQHADLHHGEQTTISVDARYYFGGRVPITRARTDTDCKARDYRPPGLEPSWRVGPNLDRHGYGYVGRPLVRLSLPPSAAEGHLDYPLHPSSPYPELPAFCKHSVAVADLSEREVGAESDIWLHPPFYLAAEVPRDLEDGDDLTVNLRSVDFDGAPLPVAKLEVSLVRRWSEPEFVVEDGERRFIGYVERRKQLPACTTKSGADGRAACTFNKAGYGSYEVLIQASDPRATHFTPTIEDWLWIPQPDDWRYARRPPPSSLTVALSTTTPKVGESVRVDVLAPWQQGRGLLILDKGGVQQLWPLRFEQGAASLELQVEDAWIPGVSFHAIAVAPGDDKTLILPTVRRADASLTVGNDTRTLAVTVEIPAEAQTGQTIPITVRARDRRDRPVGGHVSVWAVDEAVLALSPLRMPNFVGAFVVGFSAQLDLSHGYGALMLPFLSRLDPYTPLPFDMDWTNGESLGLGGLGLVGHGYGGGSGYGSGAGMGSRGGGGPAMPATRSNFSSAPIFIGDAELGKDGVARLEGSLPDNLTTFRLTAVVSSPIPGAKPGKQVEARFGSSDARVRVTRPLVVRAALPRVMRPGDTAEVGVLVDNLRGGAGQVALAVSLHDAEGVLELLSKPTAEVHVDAGGQVRVPFTIRARSTGAPEFEVRATLTPSAAGNLAVGDALRLPLPIEAERTLSDRVAVYGSLDGDGPSGRAALLPFVLPTAIDPNFGGLSVSIGSTILGGVEDAVAYLVQYPYGCVEQTSSSLLPLIPLGQLAQQGYPLGIDDTTVYVRAGVERLRSMQLPSGGFSYWPGGTVEAPFASGYATWVLGKAYAADYPVPRDMLEAADSYLLTLVGSWQARTAPSVGEHIEIALILWSLSERGLAPPAALDKLHAVRMRLPVFSRAMLMLAIANTRSGDARLPGMLDELRATIDEREAVAKVETDGNVWTWYWDSDVRSSAIGLLAMLAVDPEHPLVPKLTRGLLEARRGGRWANTQENAFSLLALAEYAAIYEADAPDFQGRVWLANQPVVRVDVEGRGFGFQDGFAPMAELLRAVNGDPAKTGGGDRLILERAGSGRMYYRVGLEWASTATDLPAKAEGVAIQRRLRDEQGLLAAGAAVDSGTLLAIDVELEVRADLDYLAAEVPLPAGLEAIDVALGKGSAAMTISGHRAHWVSHQELRRDRAVIFADRLPTGTHTTTVFVRATTPGDYVMPAATAELMYYPEIYGRSTGGRLVVR